MGKALCGKEQRHKDLGRNECMWGRERMVRDKTENRKEPNHGATLSFLLCGMTRLVFCKHPSDQKPCSGWRNTVWKLWRILNKKCWSLHQSRNKGEYEKRLGFSLVL